MVDKKIFNDFNEYWYYAKYLSRDQRKIIFGNLSSEQKKKLDNSYLEDGWSDLFYRNEIDIILDDLKDAWGFDMLQIRAKVIHGKSVYVPTKFWKIVEEQMSQYRSDVVDFIMSGLEAIPCDNNKEVSLIVSTALVK